MTDAIPQLRIRTEYSFRKAFGPLARVREALEAIHCPAAAIVDGGTWGHVRWMKELAKSSVKPLFGTELTISQPDGRKPTAWALAEDTRAFYRFSTAARQSGADVAQLFADARGVVRFAGAALTDPDCFDYIDLNPASPLQQRTALQLAKTTGKPLVVTSDNTYPAPSDFSAFMALIDEKKTTPQHILTRTELRSALRMVPDDTFDVAVRNTFEVAERCATALPTAPIIQVPGDLRALAAQGKASRIERGHIVWTDVHEARLERELTAIEQKNFQSYFLVVSDLVRWAKKRMLVGPGRGSSAGSLLCYLTDITEVDPVSHGLLFERFIDLSRTDLPDIDIDFNDAKRDEVFSYLAEKYGRECVARVGNINTLKPKSVMNRVCTRFAIPDHEKFNVLNVLVEHVAGDARYGKSLEDTCNETEYGRAFKENHPEAMVVAKIENHASHAGVHAAGVIVCNVPVSDYCTVSAEGIAHVDKPDAEKLNLLKIDALGLLTLGIIEDANVISSEELYALKLDDPEVFSIFNEQRYSALFQFEGAALRGIASSVRVDDFKTIDHLTALARPGPMGGGATQKYVRRKNGEYDEPDSWEKHLAPYVKETYGVIIFQEQVMKIVREMGKFTIEEATYARKAIGLRKGREYFDQQRQKFVDGAAQDGIPERDAVAIWESICTFGAYGMNQSHTVSYGIVSYWTAYLKRYHAIEFAAACLRRAKDDQSAMGILREMHAEGIDYVAFDIEHSAENWAAVEGKLVGGFQNLVGIGPAKAAKAVFDRNSGRMTDKAREKLLALKVKFADLFPIKRQFAALYADPEAHGCQPGSVILTADRFPESGDVLYIGKLISKRRRDESEARRVAQRNGRPLKYSHLTAFADFTLCDDTGVNIICRVGRFDFEPMGRKGLDALKTNDILMVRGKRVEGFSMIRVERMKCLTNPEALQ